MSDRAFPFLRVNDRQAVPRSRGLTEIRGPYYTPVGKYLRRIQECRDTGFDIIEISGVPADDWAGEASGIANQSLRVYCVDVHTKGARAHGETEQRPYAVVVWREAPFFTDRERAALARAEAVTLVSRDQVDLTMAAIAINAWEPAGDRFRGGGRHLPAAGSQGTTEATGNEEHQ